MATTAAVAAEGSGRSRSLNFRPVTGPESMVPEERAKPHDYFGVLWRERVSVPASSAFQGFNESNPVGTGRMGNQRSTFRRPGASVRAAMGAALRSAASSCGTIRAAGSRSRQRFHGLAPGSQSRTLAGPRRPHGPRVRTRGKRRCCELRPAPHVLPRAFRAGSDPALRFSASSRPITRIYAAAGCQVASCSSHGGRRLSSKRA